MATSNVTIQLDEELKKQAEELFSDLGFNLTTACTTFLKQSVREQGIPFNISRNVPNLETIRVIENIESGAGISKAFSSVHTLMEDLNAYD